MGGVYVQNRILPAFCFVPGNYWNSLSLALRFNYSLVFFSEVNVLRKCKRFQVSWAAGIFVNLFKNLRLFMNVTFHIKICMRIKFVKLLKLKEKLLWDTCRGSALILALNENEEAKSVMNFVVELYHDKTYMPIDILFTLFFNSIRIIYSLVYSTVHVNKHSFYLTFYSHSLYIIIRNKLTKIHRKDKLNKK